MKNKHKNLPNVVHISKPLEDIRNELMKKRQIEEQEQEKQEKQMEFLSGIF